MLLRQLAELVGDGILDRTEAGGFPLNVAYALTDYGRTLAPVIEQLCIWGRTHQGRPETQGE